MKETIEIAASPMQVWNTWERAHGEQGIQAGKSGKDRLRYQILDVKKGESFSILWKSLFVSLLFKQSVFETKKGSQIHYQVQIKGFLAWPVRLFLKKKI